MVTKLFCHLFTEVKMVVSRVKNGQILTIAGTRHFAILHGTGGGGEGVDATSPRDWSPE